MDAKHWNGDDEQDLANLSDAELDELVERQHAARYPLGCPNGCEACDARLGPLTDDERTYLRHAQAIADAIRRAATYSN
jgi:hypothetical protein